MTLFVFVVILPFIESPQWCIDEYKAHSKNNEISLTDPFLDCNEYGVPFAKLWCIAPLYTVIMDIMCILFFIYSRWNRKRWSVPSKFDDNVNIVMLITCTLSLADLLWAIIKLRRPFFAGLLRPIIVGCFLHSVRLNMIN